MSRRTILTAARAAVATAVAMALLVQGAVAGTQIGGTVSLSPSAERIVYGETVALSGAVGSSEGCQADREVRLQRRLSGSATWALIATTTSGDDGSFSFSRRPAYSAAYRALVLQADRGSVTCQAIVSGAVGTRVQALATVAPGPNPLKAGSCTTFRLSVLPAKPGQEVRLELDTDAGWELLARKALDDSSRAEVRRCYGWTSIGTIRLRAVWPAQDSLNAGGPGAAVALQVVRAPWMTKIDDLTAGRHTSVVIREGARLLYVRDGSARRVPASNEKLLESMALLDRFGPNFQIYTQALVPSLQSGVVGGNLWIVGHGDPEMNRREMALLAQRVAAAGVTRIRGSVVGSTGFFARDWFAPGWKPEFPAEDVALPTALTYKGNQFHGSHITDPERRAAKALTERLEARGVRVRGKPGAGLPPGGLVEAARVEAQPMWILLKHQNFPSANFSAEVLGKLLGAVRFGAPGTIAKGAAALAAWTSAHGVTVAAHDSSGLSYRNRASAWGIAGLLEFAEGQPWGLALRRSLPFPGKGTLEHRLAGVPVRAKTGTLEDISALSGWVWLAKRNDWAEFSILSGGLDPSRAKDVEDVIVRTVWKYAH